MKNDDREDRIDEEKIGNDSGDIKVEGSQNRLVAFLDNFWYHYKIPVVIAFFFLVLVIVCTAQMCSNRAYDTHILYAGPTQFTSNEKDQIEKELMAYGRDYNQDGATLVSFVNYQVASEAEISASEGMISSTFVVSQKQSYDNYILTGDCSVVIVSGYLYENLKENDRLLPLSEFLGTVPSNAYDDYGVKLSDTALKDKIEAFKLIPNDTYICLLRPTIIGASSKTVYFDQMKELYERMILPKS